MKKKNNKKKKNKLIITSIAKFIDLISIIIMLVLCFYVYKLGVLPGKYLLLLYSVIVLIYLVITFIITRRRVRNYVKIVLSLLLIFFGVMAGYGIKYSDKLLDTLSAINVVIVQKEDYYLYVKNDSNIDNINNKKVGVFKNSSYDKLIEELNKKNKVEIKDYDNPVNLFQDLADDEIDGVLINSALYELLDNDLSYFNLELKELLTVEVPIENDNVEEVVKVVDVTNTPFNIYIAGGDAYGKINKVMNTDVNMVVTVDPVNNKILLTSIPRDYYVNLPSKKAYDKLTHAGYYGVQESILAIEELLNIDINYYVKVNFSTIENIVDAIGGVDVYSEYSFCQYGHRSMCYKKGMNHLTKKTVLPFARERKAFSDGDVQRVKNQQAVLEAVIKKVSSSKTLLLKYSDLMDSVSNSLSTNLDSKSIRRLVNLQVNKMQGWKVESQNLVGKSSSSKTCYSIPYLNLYVMLRNQDSVDKATKKINEYLGKNISNENSASESDTSE